MAHEPPPHSRPSEANSRQFWVKFRLRAYQMGWPKFIEAMSGPLEKAPFTKGFINHPIELLDEFFTQKATVAEKAYMQEAGYKTPEEREAVAQSTTTA